MQELTASHGGTSTAQRARIFISYKRDVDPDERVVMEVCEALRQQHDVFVDQDIVVGMRWAERLDLELRRSDFLLVFLSAESVQSDMVRGEIEKAYHLAQEQRGRPILLPIRLAYWEKLPYPLNAYLDPLQHAHWQQHEDTPRLIDAFGQAIAGHSWLHSTLSATDDSPRTQGSPPVPPPFTAAQPSLRLEMPEGTMAPQSAFYVERPADPVGLQAIAEQGVTITIKGPRQIGKSSLLMRLLNAAANTGKRTVFLDFQFFDAAALDAKTFYRHFCSWITDELGLKDRVDDYWESRSVSDSLRCTRYVGRYLLPTLNAPLVLAMDEVERIFDTPFRSGFVTVHVVKKYLLGWISIA